MVYLDHFIPKSVNSGDRVQIALDLLNLCYLMVVRSNEVSLSRFDDIRMETFHENNGIYSIAVQVIDISKTSTYQELYIYPERKLIIYDWYWSMQ